VITDNHVRTARFVRTLDGDTFECVLDLLPTVVSPKAMVGAHIRVYNWNAAELDETDGPIMRTLFDQQLRRAKRIDVEMRGHSFERIVASVYLDQSLFAGLLVEHLRSLQRARQSIMPTIPDLPAHLKTSPGVDMTTPPIEWLQPTTHMIMDAVKNADFGEGKHVVVTWIATTEGVNAAVVAKVIESEKIDFKVVSWVGKKWGAPIEAGIAGQISF